MKLEAEAIRLSYAQQTILRDVTFSLPSKTRALLLGPSGSGKSSLLNIICGLQSPDGGQVTIGGQALGARADRLRKQHMGIVFQTLRLVSALDLKSNLLLAQQLQSGSKDRPLVDETCERLGIAHRMDARPRELSQGEAQRAAIARALVVKPDILIADEPTSALDQANTQTVAKLLIEVSADAGATLLIATHDDRLTTYFDRTLRLENGRIAA